MKTTEISINTENDKKLTKDDLEKILFQERIQEKDISESVVWALASDHDISLEILEYYSGHPDNKNYFEVLKEGLDFLDPQTIRVIRDFIKEATAEHFEIPELLDGLLIVVKSLDPFEKYHSAQHLALSAIGEFLLIAPADHPKASAIIDELIVLIDESISLMENQEISQSAKYGLDSTASYALNSALEATLKLLQGELSEHKRVPELFDGMFKIILSPGSVNKEIEYTLFNIGNILKEIIDHPEIPAKLGVLLFSMTSPDVSDESLLKAVIVTRGFLKELSEKERFECPEVSRLLVGLSFVMKNPDYSLNANISKLMAVSAVENFLYSRKNDFPQGEAPQIIAVHPKAPKLIEGFVALMKNPDASDEVNLARKKAVFQAVWFINHVGDDHPEVPALFEGLLFVIKSQNKTLVSNEARNFSLFAMSGFFSRVSNDHPAVPPLIDGALIVMKDFYFSSDDMNAARVYAVEIVQKFLKKASPDHSKVPALLEGVLVVMKDLYGSDNQAEKARRTALDIAQNFLKEAPADHSEVPGLLEGLLFVLNFPSSSAHVVEVQKKSKEILSEFLNENPNPKKITNDLLNKLRKVTFTD